MLPLGRGVVLDPLASSASTLAAAAAVGCCAMGIGRDAEYFALSRRSLAALRDRELG